MGNGEVLINDQPLRNKLARFIDKKIHQWAETNHPLPEPFAYTVAFTEDSEIRQVGCMTEIRLGDVRWRGYEFASDTHSAFIHSLKRLQPH